MPGRANPNQKFEDLLYKAKVARLPFDKECWLNVAFYLGEQYVLSSGGTTCRPFDASNGQLTRRTYQGR